MFMLEKKEIIQITDIVTERMKNCIQISENKVKNLYKGMLKTSQPNPLPGF